MPNRRKLQVFEKEIGELLLLLLADTVHMTELV